MLPPICVERGRGCRLDLLSPSIEPLRVDFFLKLNNHIHGGAPERRDWPLFNSAVPFSFDSCTKTPRRLVPLFAMFLARSASFSLMVWCTRGCGGAASCRETCRRRNVPHEVWTRVNSGLCHLATFVWCQVSAEGPWQSDGLAMLVDAGAPR